MPVQKNTGVVKSKTGGASSKRSPLVATPRKTTTNKARVIDTLMRRGNKAAGSKTEAGKATAGSLTLLSNAFTAVRFWYSTRIYALNVTLTGTLDMGLPGGRIIELFGDESTGKTTLCGCIMAETQSQNGIAVMHDSESTFTEARAIELEINPKELVYGANEYLEEILDIICSNILAVGKSRAAIIHDTIAGTPSKREVGKRIGEGVFSPHARALSEGLRKMSRPLANSNACVIFVNQRKEGGMGEMFATERKKDATLGGKAIKFHSTVRIRLVYARKFIAMLGKQKVHYADEITATVVKNKERASGTKCCECILVLVKMGDGGGKFSNGLTALRTLQHWNALPKGEKVKFAGKTLTPIEWEKEYNSNPKFSATVNRFLVAVNQMINSKGEASNAKVATNTNDEYDDDEEELIVS